MATQNVFQISGEGEADFTSAGPIDTSWFVASSVPTGVEVFGSLSPPRLKYAGYVAFAQFNGGTPNTRVYTAPLWLEFPNFSIPAFAGYFDHVRWSLKPGFAGELWIWTN